MSLTATLLAASANYWIGNDTVLGGPGTWSTTSTSWSASDTSIAPTTFDPSKVGIFKGGTAGTVTVSGGVTANAGLTFSTTGYSVSGDAVTLGGASAAANTITTDANVIATIGSAITASNGFIKAGAGTLNITGAVTGDATVSAGTLNIGNGGATGSINGNVTDNAAVTFARSDAYIYAGAVSGTGSVTQNGGADSTLILTGANSYTGGTTVSSGTLQIGNGGTTGSIAGAITNNAAVAFNRSDTLTYAGAISGSGSVAHNGGGSLTLSGTSSYTGATTATNGTLNVTGSLNNTSGLMLSNGADLTTGSATTIAGTTTAGANSTLSPNGDATIGTLALGSLTLNNGSSLITNLGTGNASDKFTLGATGVLTLGGGTETISLVNSVIGNYTLLTYGSLAGGNTFTLGGTLNPDFTYALVTGATATTLTITGNSYAFFDANAAAAGSGVQDGGVYGTAGMFNALANGTGPVGSLTAGQTATFSAGEDAAGLAYTVNVNTALSAAGLAFEEGNVTLAPGGGSLTLTGGTVNVAAAASATVNQAIGGAVQLNKTGAGSLTLGGSNTFTGVTVTEGRLGFSADANLGGATNNVTLAGGTLAAGADVTVARTLVLTAASTVDDGGYNLTFAPSGVAPLTPGGFRLTKAGGGTTTFSGFVNNTTTLGPLTVSAGTLALIGTASTTAPYASTLALPSAILTGDLSLGSSAAGNGIQLNLTGPVTGSGRVLLSNGSALSGRSTTASIEGNVVVGQPAAGGTSTVYLGATAGNTLTLSGVVSGNTNVVFNGQASGATAGFAVLNAKNTYTGTSVVSTTANGGVRLGVDDALATTTALSFSASSGAVDLNGRSQSLASIESAASSPIGIVNTVNGTRSTLTVAGSAAKTFAAPIGGASGATTNNIALNLSSAHTGTLTLPNVNNYTGGTTVSGGTLLATAAGSGTTSAVGQQPITADTNGTVGGVRLPAVVVGGTTAATTGGTITAGDVNATGVLTSAGQTWNPGGTLREDVSGSSAADLIKMAGLNLTSLVSGKFTINLINISTTAALGTKYVLANTTGITTPTGTVAPTAQGVNLTNLFNLSINGVLDTNTDYTVTAVTSTASGFSADLVLNYSPAPEPTTAALFGLGLTPLLSRRRGVRRV